MPVYDFECPSCNVRRTQTISLDDVDAFVAKCACGEEMKRVFAVSGVAFKGEGFYSTDKGKK